MAVVKYWFRTGISLGLILWLGAAVAAETPAQALAQRLDGLDGVVARFSQSVVNAQGIVIEESAGTLYLRKPDFRWDVDAPFPQIIIAREDELQLYDPDLEQVTLRTLSGSLDEAPLALLTRTGIELNQHFDVVELGTEAGLVQFELYPLARDALFQQLRLQFQNGALAGLIIFDHVGQRTTIRFDEYAPDQVVQSEVFELEYPPGTDFVKG